MQIIKRSGRPEEFDQGKIARAITRALLSVNQSADTNTVSALTAAVCARLSVLTRVEVEQVQDLVEEELMRAQQFQAAKSYILYRNLRNTLRKERAQLCEAVADQSLNALLLRIEELYPQDQYSLNLLCSKFDSIRRSGASAAENLHSLIQAAVELTTPHSPRFENIAALIYHHALNQRISAREQELALTSFYDKVKYLTGQGLYGDYILKSYSREEIEQAAAFMDQKRDELFTYAGITLLAKRYLIHSHDGQVLERVQEFFLGIALHLALKEAATIRLYWVQRFYDMLSRLEVTMATPTLANARKPFCQLSSCFIDTVPDSLSGIYRSLDNFAQVSKFGGGMGMYLGKVRAMGSDIRGFKGAAGGTIRWIRLINDTAVAVDQLGVRQGACAVYLDIWHRDLPEFLQLRTNNGDERMKAHDIFPAVCVPDFFYQEIERNLDGTWQLICPHEVKRYLGFALEDYFGKEWEERYQLCLADPRIEKRAIPLKDLVRLLLKSAAETGTPFIFNRDTVNRANPNSHAGCIYSSNLCTEIAQNMSEISEVTTQIRVQDRSATAETADKDGTSGTTEVVTVTRPGDFVVCNLASLSLGRLALKDRQYLSEVTQAAVRALDNVISLNFYPLPYAGITCEKYRGIGLGVSGYHHYLARRGIAWESEEHLQEADSLFEDINYASISASCALAQEKGACAAFAGSKWQSGEYFSERGYHSARWQELAVRVKQQGLRNASLLAIAPTSSTSIIAGTSAGIDPVMNKFFYEEKKGSMLPRAAPDLSPETFWLYKSAHDIDQNWSVRACGIRQRHIDQAQSMNLYITTDYTLRRLLNLYLSAWHCGVKTIYYVRSRSLTVKECVSCSA